MTDYRKKSWLMAMTLPLIIGGLSSCSSDDESYSAVDNQAPVITLASDHVQTEAGRAFTIEGTIKDADGIKSINLKNEGMMLDKTINLLEIYDELQKEYNLKYTYQRDYTKEWTDDSTFPVVITVEDVMGNKQTGTVTVTADGDFTNPVFAAAPSENLIVLLQNPKLRLNCIITDNKKIAYVQVSCPELNINDRVEANVQKEFQLKKVYELPAIEASYNLTITAYDTFDNKVETRSTVTISELPDFEKMYLADVEDARDLTSDIYGVPMLIDHTGEYEYTARYYNQKAGTKVRFIPQMTDFDPICFGLDPNDNTVLTSSSESEGIQLDEVAYYEIKFNTISGTYSVKTYTPDTEAMKLDGTSSREVDPWIGQQPELICLAGEGIPGTPGWTTNQDNDAYILLQDEKNPYLLYGYMDLEKDGPQIQFTISQVHGWGWWPEPFWRFDGSEMNEKNVLNGGDNMTKMDIPATGRYRFEFDYHLLRSRIILVK